MFKNLALKSDIAHMSVLTTGVVTRKAYVSIVMAGQEIIDMEVAETEEDAHALHHKFVEMCSIFAPIQQKTMSGDEAQVKEGLDELHNLQLLIQSHKAGMVH